MDLKDWIKSARAHKGWTQQQLGDAVNRSKANVGHWENGKHEPKLDIILAIADRTGFPPPKLGRQEQSNVEPGPLNLRSSRLVPVVGHVKAGDDGYLERMDYPVGTGEGCVEYWVNDQDAFALRIKGDSMHPRYRAGEFVIITPNIEAVPGRDVVVTLRDGKKLLKQFNWLRDGELQLLSINNGYAPMTIDRYDIESIHRVAGSVPPDAFTPC